MKTNLADKMRQTNNDAILPKTIKSALNMIMIMTKHSPFPCLVPLMDMGNTVLSYLTGFYV